MWKGSKRSEYRIYCACLLVIFYVYKLFLPYATVDTFLSTSNGVHNAPTFHGRSLLETPNSINVIGRRNCTPRAINNFPRDHFTQSQRRSGAVIFHIVVAAYMFLGLAIVCDEYFIPCLEVICQVLGIQADVAGATFMAAGSSAPELATTLIGVFIARDDIGLGAVVGSADYNVMFVISVCALFSKEVIYLNWWPLVRDCVFYLISIILLAAVIDDERVYWYEALIFLVFYAFYILLMRFNPQLDRWSSAWCLAHPTLCPRMLHLDRSQTGFIGQGSGKFGCVSKQLHQSMGGSLDPVVSDDRGLHPGAGGGAGVVNTEEFPVTNYSRLKDDEGSFQYSAHVSDGVSGVENEVTITESAPHIKKLDTWFEVCFSSLSMPLRGSKWYRWVYYVIAWPLRFLLCLTTPDCKTEKWRRFHGHWITFIMSCAWIGVYTALMIWMITVIGYTLGIPDTIMGLTLIAAGSSVPDAITSVIVVREGEGDMAIANAVGSNIFDILICMGLPWLLRCVAIRGPVVIYSHGMTYASLTLFMTVLILLLATHLNRWRLTKMYGVGLMIAYLAFLVVCSLYELNVFSMVHPPECPLFELP